MQRSADEHTMEIRYRASPLVLVGSILFFVFCAAVLTRMALGDAPPDIRGLDLVSPQAARVVAWVLVAFSAGIVLMGASALVKSFGSAGRIVLTPDSITAPPRVVDPTSVTIPYVELLEMEITRTGGQSFLTLTHSTGKICLSSLGLPREWTVERIADVIDARAPSALP